ncbi:MAG: hypothetical protein U0V70_15990 [Terriglobia bacterium]
MSCQRIQWKLIWFSLVLWSLLGTNGLNPSFGSTTNGDAKTAAVDLFMQARTLESDVEARKLMTANLENHYLRNKRLSVRVRSGRVVAYNFDPDKIAMLGDKAFRLEVESLWADLNEIVYATQIEKIKFLKVREEWLADEIDFIKTVPRPRVLPFNVASEKRGKDALATAKIFMKGLINRNAKMVTQRLTQDFQSRYSSPQEMEKFLFGPEEPHFVAYEPNSLTQIEPGEMEVRVRIFLVAQGRRGSASQEARLTVKEGRSDWNISDFEFLSRNQSK